MHWFWLAWLLAGELWDDELWDELATRAVQLARDAGALGELPIALIYRAAVHVYAGEIGAATALIAESGAITAVTGQAPLMFTTLLLAGWQGDERRRRRRFALGRHERERPRRGTVDRWVRAS